LVIELGFEETLRVYLTSTTAGDRRRAIDWVCSSRERCRLVVHAIKTAYPELALPEAA
jgi:hypothetical protein